MIKELDKVIEQPTDMNNRIILYTEMVAVKVDGYIDKVVAETAFGREGFNYTDLGNDFLYLLVHLLSAYEYSETQTNAGVTYGEEEVYADYGLEAIRQYFSITHAYDVVPLYDIFELRDSDCDPNTLFGPAIDYVDLDCLIPN